MLVAKTSALLLTISNPHMPLLDTGFLVHALAFSQGLAAQA